MSRRGPRKSGFALLLVLVGLGVAVLLGLSYLSSAAVKADSSSNLLRCGRAKYLAESAVQHALYVFRADPISLDGSESSPLGPYYVDDTDDSYTFYAVQDPTIPDRYVVTGRRTVGGITQSVSAVVYCADPMIVVNHGLVVDHRTGWFPESVTVNGPVHSNAKLNNRAYINGDVSSSKTVNDPQDRITGTITENADRVPFPPLKFNKYQDDYYVNGAESTTTRIMTDVFGAGDPLADGGAVTSDNVAGVVMLDPSGNDVLTLTNDLNFLGTLVIKGDLVLDGSNITLTPVDGFPALIVSGQVYITNNADVQINGLVIATKGIFTSGETDASRTQIDGGLVCKQETYSSTMEGQHTVNFVPGRCQVYNVIPTMELLTWID